jgi:hypothetical protein
MKNAELISAADYMAWLLKVQVVGFGSDRVGVKPAHLEENLEGSGLNTKRTDTEIQAYL